jgi:hypothetical protein
MSHPRDGCTLDRRGLVLGAAGAVATAGLAGPLARPARAERRRKKDLLPVPNPIPGGIPIPPDVIHVFAPGDPAITLPFTGATLQGFDYEPSTITDYRGSSAVAFHVGTATGSDGKTYDLETDMRAYEGEFVVDGTTYEGAFAFV